MKLPVLTGAGACRTPGYRGLMRRQALRRGERAKAGMSRLTVGLQVMAAVVILVLGWWGFQRGGYFRPISFPADQVYEHLPADQPERLKGLIRVPGADVDHRYWDQNFGIVIDRAGHSGTVKFLPSADSQPAPPP